MDSIFNNNLAKTFQYWTIWFEVVGFTLTFIEVLKPDLADKIERFIDNLHGRPRFIHTEEAAHIFARLLVWLLLSPFFALILGIVGFFISLYGEGLEMVEAIPLLVAIIFFLELLLVPLILVLMLGLKLFSNLINLLNTFSDGRALGTIGLILALIGLFGEAYQYITMVRQ